MGPVSEFWRIKKPLPWGRVAWTGDWSWTPEIREWGGGGGGDEGWGGGGGDSQALGLN